MNITSILRITRKGIPLAVAVVAATAIAACGGDSGTDTPSGDAASGSGGGEGQELKVIGFVENMPQSVLDGFEAETGGTVTYEFIPSADFPTVLQTRISGKTDVDVVNLRGGPEFRQYAKAGSFAELGDQPWQADLAAGAVDAGTYDGTIYGYSVSSYVIGVWYSKTLFADNGVEVPTSWAEFEQASATLKAAGVDPLAVSEGEGWTNQYVYHSAVANWAAENPTYMADLAAGKATWADNSLFTTQVERWQALKDAGYFMTGSASAKYDDAQQAFNTGRAAMWIMGNWSISGLDETKSDEFGVFPLPINEAGAQVSAPSSLSDNVFTVTSWTPKADLAEQFLEYLAQPEAAQAYAEANSRASTTKGVTLTGNAYLETWSPLFDTAVAYPLDMGPSVNGDGPTKVADMTAGGATPTETISAFDELQAADSAAGY